VSLYARVVHHPIRVQALVDEVGGPEDGAVLVFLGTVRDHNDGRRVEGVRYEAYESMAREVLEEILVDASRATGVDRIGALHRVGELSVGDVSVAIVVASPHREQAYAASRRVIEEIKARLPVWKKELYVDGRETWLEGRDPRFAGSPAGRSAGGSE
jgi:molybdopterin synthase catalytic subunit